MTFRNNRSLCSKRLILCLIFVAGLFVIVSGLAVFDVLEISSENRLILVRDGDTFDHEYTHSMYQAPVTERFVITGGRLKLIKVDSPCVAVLEYFGLNGPEVGHMNLLFDSFTTPSASIGSHRLKIRGQDFNPPTGEGLEGKIRVKLRKASIIDYLISLF
ncbi:MAG: hypothetical protein PHS86_03660 [Syntrophaceae bacterium]|nr:hypothetical protein [Syntrophaceae bacterium]